MNIAVTTIDARMKAIFKNLSSDFHVLDLHETKDFYTKEVIDVLILPVKGITKTGNIKQNHRELKVPSSFWEELPASCKIFCGLPQEFLNSREHQIDFYMHSEYVLEKNAILTAEGVLFLLIDNTSKSIQQLQVDIIGFGRCGRELHKWLNALHVPTRIVRRKKDRLVNTMDVQEWLQLEPSEVIINTSIQSIMNKEILKEWNNKPLIIDIATPDVIDQEAANKLGIHMIKAGNLPSLIAYESAGNLIADYIRGKLNNGK